MSRVLDEPHITPTALARLVCLEQTSRPIHAGTIIRWITRGVCVRGQTVKLDAIRLGGRWVTSRSALDRFMARLTAASSAEAAPPSVATPATEDERADRELSSQGW
jgi:hypothetical protein